MSENRMALPERERSGDTPISVLKLPQVISRTGLKRSTVYSKIKEGAFPKQTNLGVRSVGWLADEVDQWIQSRIDASRSGDSE